MDLEKIVTGILIIDGIAFMFSMIAIALYKKLLQRYINQINTKGTVFTHPHLIVLMIDILLITYFFIPLPKENEIKYLSNKEINSVVKIINRLKKFLFSFLIIMLVCILLIILHNALN